MSKKGKEFEQFLREQTASSFDYDNLSASDIAALKKEQERLRKELGRVTARRQSMRQDVDLAQKTREEEDKQELTPQQRAERESRRRLAGKQPTVTSTPMTLGGVKVSPTKTYDFTDTDQEAEYNSLGRELTTSQQQARKIQQEIERREGRGPSSQALSDRFIDRTLSTRNRPEPAKKPSVEDLMKPQPGEIDPITGESDWDGRYLTRGQRERLAGQPSTSAPTPTKRAGVDLSADTPDWVRRHEAKFGTESAREIEGMRLGVVSALGGDPTVPMDPSITAAEAIRRGQMLDRDRKQASSSVMPYGQRTGSPLEDPNELQGFVDRFAPEKGENLPYRRRAGGIPTVSVSPTPPPAPAPDLPPPPAPVPTPIRQTEEEKELQKLRDQLKNAEDFIGGQRSAVGPSMYPAIPASMAARIASYTPPPELPEAPAPELGPRKGQFPAWYMRMQNQPLPPSPPVEGLPYDRTKPLEKSENLPETPPSDWWKQSVTARPPGISQEFSPTDLSGVGLYGGVLGQMRFARGQKPSQPEVGAMGPSRSEAELSRMMRDAREAPSAVGSSTFPGIPSSVASLIAAYSPAPAPDPAPAPEAPASFSDLELAKMKRDARESESRKTPVPSPRELLGLGSLPPSTQETTPGTEAARRTLGISPTEKRKTPQSLTPEQRKQGQQRVNREAEATLVFNPETREWEYKNLPPRGFDSWSQYNDVMLQQMAADEASDSREGFGPGARKPSGLEQAMRLAQGAGEFGRNLDQAAGRKVREVGQKIGEIAKSMGEKSKTARSRIAVPGVDVEGPSRSEAGLSRLMRDARESEFAPAPDPAPAPLPTSSLSTPKTPISKFPDEYAKWYPPILGPVEMGQQGPEFDEIEQPTQNFNLTPEGPVTVQIYDRKSGREKAIRRMIGMDPIGQLEY